MFRHKTSHWWGGILTVQNWEVENVNKTLSINTGYHLLGTPAFTKLHNVVADCLCLVK